ncbi:DUF4407 domain-containing protein [Lacihabitans soyangensis]|nr:DUF4407 domain-containing protein [Lacihabitans soyangensis]
MEKLILSKWDKFFIRIAGHNPETVEKTTPAEKSRIVNLGLVLFIPVIMGGISGGYAATFISPAPYAWTFGIVWALVIYLIDRAIISITDGGFWVFAIRIIMAIVIGLVISFPVKVKIFEDVINEQQFAEINALRVQIENRYQKRIQDAQAEANKQEANKNKLYQEFKDEMDGSGGTEVRGYSTISKRKEEAFNEANKSYLTEKEAFDKNKSDLTNQKNNELENLKQSQANGLIGKYKALGRVAEKEPFVNIVSWLLWFFFTILELVPLLVKIMSKGGLYNSIVKSDANARLVATENINQLKIQAETMAETVPNEQKINAAKVKIVQDKISAETEMAKAYSAELAKLWKQERKNYEDLSKMKITPERFDKLADQMSEIFDKASDNIFDHSKTVSPESIL